MTKEKLKCIKCGSTIVLEGKVIVTCLVCWSRYFKTEKGELIKW